MKKENFTYSFTSSKSSEDIFELLLDIPKWWSGQYEETINGKSRNINDEFSFLAGGGMHYSNQKLVELIPNKRVVWLVNDSKLTFLSDPGEWKDTRFSFDIANENNKTKVTFTHDGLVQELECYDSCSTGWTKYLQALEKKLS